MNKRVLLISIIFAVIFSQIIFVSADCETIHCFNITSITESNPNTQITSDSCYVTVNSNIDGIQYGHFGVPGLKVTSTGFGLYNLLCDNGWPTTAKEFFIQRVTPLPSGTVIEKTNTVTGTKPISAGRNYCTGPANCPTGMGDTVGKGETDSITHNFNTTGGFNYKLYQASAPVANATPTNLNLKTDENYYIGVPSLIVLGPNDINSGFYETRSTYVKEITFTLLNKSPLRLKLENYDIKCPGSGTDFTCQIDRNYINNNIRAGNGELVIRGTITINKERLRTTPMISGGVLIDVNYLAVDLNNKPSCVTYYKNNTSSQPMSFGYGLLDSQKFQIGLDSQIEYDGCIGEDGMIGVTGVEMAPRINVGFGGAITDGAVSIDECDSDDLEGNNNSDWVYCSKKEFLVELARKILRTWKIQSDINNELNQTSRTPNQDLLDQLDANKSKLLTFKANIRKQSFTNQKIQESLNALDTQLDEYFQTSGLAQELTITDTDLDKQKNLTRKLFNRVKFTFNGGEFENESTGTLNTGEYTVEIKIDQNFERSTQTYLFVDGNYLKDVNPNVSITVNFVLEPGTEVEPNINWFFYDFGDEDFDDLITQNAQKTFSNTNIINRGELLILQQNFGLPDINAYVFSPSYAVPIFVRLKTDQNGDMNRHFVVPINEPLNTEFSSWTGIASSVENGCIDIKQTIGETLPNLPYREFDSNDSRTQNGYYFSQFDGTLLSNKTIYLQTILFWPNTITPGGKMMSANFRVYTKNSDNNSGPVTINQADPEFKIDNLSDVVNGIKDRKVCVHQSISSNLTTWTLFWNTKSIYDTISARKENVISVVNRDANICQERKYLGS